MNGKLEVSIDEEALFEVLATANFAAPAGKAPKPPAAVIESTSEASSIFPWFPYAGDHKGAVATL